MSSEVKKNEGEFQAMHDRSIETASGTDMLARYDAVRSNAEETQD